MPVSHLHTDPGRAADLTARELVFLAGPDDLWLLPEDGVLDPCAVAVAADGARHVRLTTAERVAAAIRILTSGGNVHNVCLRLGLPEGTESKWLQLHCQHAANEIIQQIPC